MVTRIQLRRDSAANWTNTNPTLDQGEPGFETDTGNMKIGDGSTSWTSLSYAAGPSGPSGGGGGSGGITQIVAGQGLSGGTITSSGTIGLDIAGASQLGGIKVGSGLSIAGDGTLSTSGGGGGSYTLPAATTSALGGVIIPAVATSGITNTSGTIGLATASSSQLGGVKIDNSTITINGSGQLVASGGGSYTLPTASQTTLGGVKLGSVLSVHQANAQSSVSTNAGSAVTTIVYDTVNFSSLPSGASYSTSTGEFTPGITGYYQVNASATITTAGAPGGYAPQVGLGIAVYDTNTHSAPAVIGDIVDFNLVLGAWGDTTPLVTGVIKITSTTQRICIVSALAEQAGHTGGTYPTNPTNPFNSVLSIAFLRSL